MTAISTILALLLSLSLGRALSLRAKRQLLLRRARR
jgi:hypothetical protein